MKRILNNIKTFIYKYKKIMIIFIGIIIILIGVIINNQNKFKIISNSNDNNEILKEFSVTVTGEVIQSKKIVLYKETYLFEIIKMCGGFTKYSDISNINLISKISSSCLINIKRSNVINDNKINIINNDNINNNNNNNNIYIYLGRIDNKINIYKFNKNKTYKEIFWLIGVKNIYNVDENEILYEDLYINSNNKIGINSATVDDLININIKKSIAISIIETRDKNGIFKNIKEIIEIDGINNQIKNIIEEYIYID